MNSLWTSSSSVAVTMDLYGRTGDARLMLWKRAAQVVPTNAFERNGRWITSGHYVIGHYDNVIVAHCGNVAEGVVSVQFMHDELQIYEVRRCTIEPMVLGKMVVSEEQQASVVEGRRLSTLFQTAAIPLLPVDTLKSAGGRLRRPGPGC
jgi:hypothetical protein